VGRRSSRLALFALATALAGCEAAPPEAVSTPVKVSAVRALEGAQALTYSAEIEPETTLDLAFRTDGYVRDIATRPSVEGGERLLQAGDLVDRGEELARIDDREYRDRVQTAAANLEKAKAAAYKAEQDYGRAEALHKTESITGPDYDAAKTEFDSTRAAVEAATAQLDQAQAKLEDTRLVAPMAATVLQREIEQGTLVHGNTVGFVLAKTETVKAVFGLPDTALSAVDIGAATEVHTASVPGRSFPGVVTKIAAAADDRTHLYDVSVSIQNADGTLRPGMIAALALSGDHPEKTPVGVPLQAVIQSPQGAFAVYVVQGQGDDTIARLQVITTGQVVGNEVVVTAGLERGQDVVVKGTAQLTDGQSVRVVQ